MGAGFILAGSGQDEGQGVLERGGGPHACQGPRLILLGSGADGEVGGGCGSQVGCQTIGQDADPVVVLGDVHGAGVPAALGLNDLGQQLGMDADVQVALSGELAGEAPGQVGGSEGQGAIVGGEVDHLQDWHGGLGWSHADQLLQSVVQDSAINLHGSHR